MIKIMTNKEIIKKDKPIFVYEESMKTDQYFGDTLSVLSENIQELRLGR